MGILAGTIKTISNNQILEYQLYVHEIDFFDLKFNLNNIVINPSDLKLFSYWDGLSNTILLHEKYNINILDNDFNSYYIPAVNELELLYRRFKPTTDQNFIDFDKDKPYPNKKIGYNPNNKIFFDGNLNDSEYTLTNPSQTDIPTMKYGGINYLRCDEFHLSSTPKDANHFFGQLMSNGIQYGGLETSRNYNLRLVYRVLG